VSDPSIVSAFKVEQGANEALSADVAAQLEKGHEVEYNAISIQ